MSDRRFLAAYVVCALAALVPLWSVKYPPMVDVPQHAAQIFLWKHFDDPAYAFADTYQLSYSSPYFLGYALARAFAVVLPTHDALKAVVTLVLLLLPWAMERLLTAAGADRWWSLLAFPLTYSFAFHWGFFNYVVALPVGVVFIRLGWDYARAPARQGGLLLSFFAFLLYYCHALAFGVCVASVAALLFVSVPGLRRKVLVLLPLVPPVVFIGLWVVALRAGNAAVTTPNVWSESPWERLLRLPALLLGGGQTTGAWWVGGFLLLALPFASGAPRRDWRTWSPCLAAVAIYFVMPNRTLGTWFVYERLAFFIPILACAAIAPANAGLRRRLGRAVLVAFTVGWMAFLSVQFRPIDRAGRDLDVVLEEMEDGKDVLGLIFDNGTEYAAGLPVFGHAVAWYQARKGGRVEFSFAVYFPQLVRYKEGQDPLANPQLLMAPDRFNWQRDGNFDYFLVRSTEDRGASLFKGATAPVVLVARSGDWWLFRRLR